MTSPDHPQPRPRILFVAEAVTLAHVTRSRVLAEGLDPTRYEVHFAADRAFDWTLAGLRAQRWPLTSISPQRFMDALARGVPLYDTPTLEAYVADDLALFERVRPDLIVGDFRLSLAISAPLRGVPCFALANAYWSPHADVPRWPIPDLPPARLFGAGLAGAMFNALRPLLFYLHGRPLNLVRRRHGLPPVGDMLSAYTWGDETLFLDPPPLIPMVALPPHHRFIGPVMWEPATALPDWWNRLPRDRKMVYVTLGSSGPAALLPGLLSELARLPVSILVATAGRVPLDALPAGVWAAEYLPGSAAAARADLVISNGGSPTGYQALSQGTPVIGIPSNLDQHLATGNIVAAGAGAVLRSDRATPSRLSSLVDRVLAIPAYRESARRVQGWIADTDASAVLASRIAARLRSPDTREAPHQG